MAIGGECKQSRGGGARRGALFLQGHAILGAHNFRAGGHFVAGHGVSRRSCFGQQPSAGDRPASADLALQRTAAGSTVLAQRPLAGGMGWRRVLEPVPVLLRLEPDAVPLR